MGVAAPHMLTLLFAPDPDEAAILTLILERAGFEVRLISEADRVAQAWQDRPVELFLFAFVDDKALTPEYISQLRLENQAPIVLLLERSDERRQGSPIEAGADLIFARPFRPARLAG